VIVKRLKGVIVALLIFLFVGFASYELMNSRSFQIFGNIYNKIETQEKVVALTFDDGPTEMTELILNELNDLDIKATFFLVGSDMRENPELIEKIVENGHQIASHSFTHTRMIFKSPRFLEEEVRRTNIEIRNAGYEGNLYFRPPYGKKLLFLPYVLRKYDMPTIMWSIEPETNPEIAKDSELIAKHILNNISPGDIILLHPMYKQGEISLESLRKFVPKLKEMGYEFKLISEVIK
jgi:chitin deacetylase